MSEIIVVPSGYRAQVNPAASGFAHGFGLFETMRLSEGRLSFWKAHWSRLSASADFFDLEMPDEAEALDALRELVAQRGLRSGTLKMSLLKETSGSCLYVYSRPSTQVPKSIKLRLDTLFPIYARSLLAGHKTHNYMESMELLDRARQDGYYDLLRLNTAGHLAETTTANLFFIKDGRLHTPALGIGILPGVTRAALMKCANCEIEEGRYLPEVLFDADAAFVTNSSIGVQQIDRIEGLAEGKSVEYSGDSSLFDEIQAKFQETQAERSIELF